MMPVAQVRIQGMGFGKPLWFVPCVEWDHPRGTIASVGSKQGLVLIEALIEKQRELCSQLPLKDNLGTEASRLQR